MILEESVLRKRQEELSRLEVIYPTDGTIIIPSTVMIVADRWSANRNTGIAEKITDWLLGPDGQSVMVGGWMHSVRSDYPRNPFGSISMAEIQANNIPFNWENVFRHRNEIQDRFEELALSSR